MELSEEECEWMQENAPNRRYSHVYTESEGSYDMVSNKSCDVGMLEYYKSKPEDFMVKKHSTKDLYIVKYLHSGIDWSQPYALDARGIVLDGDSNVISRPYTKFFNYKELEYREDLPNNIKGLSEWNDEPYHVFDKLDGSLAVISQYEGELLYSSSGNIEGEYPDKFKNWVENNLTRTQQDKLLSLTESFTLIFEYVSPKDRIVLSYDKEELILHGLLDTESGIEVNKPYILRAVGEFIGVGVVEEYEMSLDDMLKAQKGGLGDKLIEGFVVSFISGKRLKIKTQEYLDIHGKATIGFGKMDSKAKIKMYIKMIEDDEIDDFVAFYQQRGDKYVVQFLDDVCKVHQNFTTILNKAKELNKQEGFSKRDWAINEGTKGIFNNLVLNVDKDTKVDRLKYKYMLSVIGERMKYLNG